MPHLLPATARRSSTAVTLSKAESAQRKRQAEDIDALFSETETIDLLPLSTLVALTERARAA
ncbi:MAG TPA: hypothetical protein VG328_03275 [Stellaceae bacterium]|jgi:hypothetical protein|nr:hypothetical protein [Stellaceae bacterium]